jgi:hypothetical protein
MLSRWIRWLCAVPFCTGCGESSASSKPSPFIDAGTAAGNGGSSNSDGVAGSNGSRNEQAGGFGAVVSGFPDAYVPSETLRFDPPRGLYDAATSLELSTNLPGTIRYTLDGSEPSATNGTEYAGPVPIETTATVRAVVIASGAAATPIGTHTYILPRDVLEQSDDSLPAGDYVFWTNEMDPIVTRDPAYSGMLEGAFRAIPTMSIVGPDAEIFGEDGIHRGNNLEAEDLEVKISLEMFYPADYPRPHAGGFQIDGGVKIQGGGGRWDNGEYDHKQSFGLRFRSSYGNASLSYPVFEDAPLNGDSEAGKYDKLILRAGHNKSWGATWDNDHTVYTRDQLGRDLQINMGGMGVHGTFVHLYLNGLYWGLYNVTERPDDAHASNYLGGTEAEHYFGKGKGGDGDGDNERVNYWRDTVAESGDWALLQEYLAVDQYIDVALSNAYAATGDFPQYYFTNRFGEEPGPLHFWNWDVEDAFGGGSRRSGPPSASRLEQCDEFESLWENFPEFRERFAARADLHVAEGGALSDASVIASWNALTAYIEAAIVLESARWGDERIDDTGQRYTRDNQWASARDLVTDDLAGRARQLVEALRDGGYHP